MSPLDKKILHRLQTNPKLGSGLPREVLSSTTRATLNPMWNEELILGSEFLLDSSDYLVVTCRRGPVANNVQDLAYAFVPLRRFSSSSESINEWFPLEVLEEDPTGIGGNYNSSGELEEDFEDFEGDSDAVLTRWRVVGEILLSLHLRGANLDVDVKASAGLGMRGGGAAPDALGDLAEKQPANRAAATGLRRLPGRHGSGSDLGEADEVMVVSAALDQEEPDEPWSKSSAVLVFDVFDEDDFTRRDFIGRATLPLRALVADDRVQDQPVRERWVPLSLRFDGSKADHTLWSVAQGRAYIGSASGSVARAVPARVTRNSIGSALKSALGRALGSSGKEKEPFGEIREAADLSEPDESRFPTGGSPRLRSGASDADLSFDWAQPGMPFGEILVRTQLVLSDPAAEEAFKAAEEAKKADRGGRIEQARLVMKMLQTVQDEVFAVNNTLEQVKNLFNWTHPRKTKMFMQLLCFLLVLFLVIPSRYIVLFVGIFLFTERFRPLGVLAIKFKHLVALLPTNDDLVHLYTKGPLLGSLEASKSVASGKVAQLGGDEDATGATTSQVSRISGARFYQGMRDTYLNLGLLHQSHQTRSREAQENKFIVSESDCKAFGHLRMLQHGRSKTWRRYYFAIAHQQLMYWEDKEDLLVRVAQGGFGDMVEISKILPGSPDATFLAKKGVKGETRECTFCISHPEKYKLRAEPAGDKAGATESATKDMLQKLASGANFSNRIRTYLVANSAQKRDYWIENLRTHCATKSKVNKLL